MLSSRVAVKINLAGDSMGHPRNLDFALNNRLGLDSTPETASPVLSNFFNSKCAGFKT